MHQLHPLQEKTYYAFRRLLQIINSRGKTLSGGQIEHLYWLGGEHTFCRDTVHEILTDNFPHLVKGHIRQWHQKF